MAPEPHDYPGARSFLSLNAKPKAVRRALEKLRSKDCVNFRANDLLRASGSVLLPDTDPDVAKELKSIRDDEAFAPCLIVRGSLGSGYLPQIADGYRRICAVYLVAYLPVITPELVTAGSRGAAIDPGYRDAMRAACAALYELDNPTRPVPSRKRSTRSPPPLGGLGAMVSHRSGETDDTFVADLVVGAGCGQLKSGAPARGERVAKYNRLLEIADNNPDLPYGPEIPKKSSPHQD